MLTSAHYEVLDDFNEFFEDFCVRSAPKTKKKIEYNALCTNHHRTDPTRGHREHSESPSPEALPGLFRRQFLRRSPRTGQEWG